MGAVGAATEAWRTAGGVLQLCGVLIIAYGILQLREQLDPERSSLAAGRRHLAAARATWRNGRRRARTLARRWLRAAQNWWRRLLGRPTHQYVNVGSALSGEITDSISAHGTVTAPPTWASLSIDEKLDDLHRRVQAQASRSSELTDTVARHRAELDAAIEETRQHVRELHLGGLSVEVWGTQLLLAGLVMGTWPSWVATNGAAQAGLMGWLVLTVALWVTSEERPWWLMSRG